MDTITQEEAIKFCQENYNNPTFAYVDVGRPQQEKGDKMVEAYNRLKSLKAVAQEFNCTLGNVRMALVRRGVKMNKPGRKAASIESHIENVMEQTQFMPIAPEIVTEVSVSEVV
jgi:hypothetical protein